MPIDLTALKPLLPLKKMVCPNPLNIFGYYQFGRWCLWRPNRSTGLVYKNLTNRALRATYNLDIFK